VIHLCGDPRAEELIRAICERTDDKFIVRKYERLSSLHVGEETAKSIAKLQEGDCIVCFSRKRIF